MLNPDRDSDKCAECGSPVDQSGVTDGGTNTTARTHTKLETLPTTSSGSVKKADAMEWLEELDRPTSAELKRSTIEKPSDFSGSTFPTDISTIRVTGDPSFIETVAGLFSWIVEMEDYSRRVEINLKQTEDKETGEETENYALYLSVAERGGS